MSNHKKVLSTATVFVVGLLLLLPVPRLKAAEDKLKVDDLIAKHLEAIGPPSARATKTRVATGGTKLAVLIGGVGNVTGQAVMASSGRSLRFAMRFPVPDYPREEVAFDGTRATSSLLPNGRRSNLGLFIQREEILLKEGLIGGVLSTAWPLLRLAEQQPKIEYRGLKKIEGRQLHEVSYRPRKGPNDLKISLFFEADTFRHVRSKYRLVVAGTIGTRTDPDQNPDSYHELTEDFSDFRNVDGLTLPFGYKLRLEIQDRVPVKYEYQNSFADISHKERLGEGTFVIN
jgi:hypothetical protein